MKLYQSMLEEAVQMLKEHGEEEREDQWSPTINIGMPVLLPEAYVPDLQVRLGLYRRLSSLKGNGDVENFAGELADRFGPLPEEVKHLLTVVQIKNYCRQAGIAQVDAGPKGALITFRNKKFANPQGLVKFMHDQGANVKLQPDHRLVFKADWEDGVERLKGARALARNWPTSPRARRKRLKPPLMRSNSLCRQSQSSPRFRSKSRNRSPFLKSQCTRRRRKPKAGNINAIF